MRNCAPNVSLNVNRYFTDVDGQIINKATLPLSFQLDFPFYLLGNYDSKSGYRKGIKNVPPQFGSTYLCSFIYGVQIPFLQLTGLNTIKNFCDLGDIVHVYVDDLNNPDFYCWIVQSGNNVGAYSLISSLEGVTLDSINIVTDTPNQIQQKFTVLMYNKTGEVTTQDFTTENAKSPLYKQESFTRLNISAPLSDYIAFATYFTFASTQIAYTFNLK